MNQGLSIPCQRRVHVKKSHALCPPLMRTPGKGQELRPSVSSEQISNLLPILRQFYKDANNLLSASKTSSGRETSRPGNITIKHLEQPPNN